MFSRVRQVPLSRTIPSLPPAVPPQSKFSPERRRGLRSKSKWPEALRVHDCPDHNVECPSMTSSPFFFKIIPGSITVGCLKPDHLRFFSSRCRNSKDDNDGSIRFLRPLFFLISVPLLLLVMLCDFHIYISYLYIFTRYKTDPLTLLSKHIERGERESEREKGEGGGERFSVQNCHMICPLLETGFFFCFFLFLKKKDPAPYPWMVGDVGGRGRRGRGGLSPSCYYVIWCGASSISMRKVSMGVSPMSLKKNKCSRHLRPMERSAGNRSNSLANLSQHKSKTKTPDWQKTSAW